MKTKNIIRILVIFILLVGIFALPALASKEKDDTGSGWNIYFRPGVRFGTEGRTLYIMDLLTPLYQDDKNILFSNIKYTPNNRGGWELNRGVGYRRLLWDDKLILGLNAYYDQRKTDWGTKHRQWGVGLEAMADIPLKSFDLGLTGRFNYYYPLSHTKIDGLGTASASYILSDSGIILNSGQVEEPMRGFDYEAGVRIPYVSDYVETWAYVGGYNYQGRRVRDINGFQARLEVIPTDFIRLNYEFHHDNYSKAQHYGEVSLELPFSIGNLVKGKNPFEGIGDMLTGSRDLEARMVEPTKRDVDVKVIVDEDNDNIPGGGGEIEDVIFVSETGVDAPGNGTKENPYATISYALANNAKILAGTCTTIHVMNSSTTAVIADSPTINIANMLLWGSGADHPKYSNILNMPFTGHPTINDTLNLNATNPTITGLGFDVAGNPACIAILAGVGSSGIKITNNSFFMSRAGLAYGIYSNIGAQLGTETNPVIIANNSFDIESTTLDAYGINLVVSGANNDIFTTISGNDMSRGIEGDGITMGINLSSTGGGIGSVTSPLIISGNPMSVTSNGGTAVGILSNASGDIFSVIYGNDMSGGISGFNAAEGIRLNSSNGSLGSAARPVFISGNPMTVTGTTGESTGIALLASNSDVFATIVGNDMSNAISGIIEARGIFIDAGTNLGSEARPLIISGNSMTVNAIGGIAYGIYLSQVTNNMFTDISGNDMSGGITGVTAALGIYIPRAGGNLGSDTRPLLISGNPMYVNATGANAQARGIMLVAANGILARIVGNNMSGGIIGNDSALGIYLFSGNGNIGSAARPVIVSGNPMKVTANTDDALGIYIRANDDLFANVKRNYMDVTAAGDAFGAYLTAGNLIGSSALTTFFYENSGIIDANNRYMLMLFDGAAGSFVNWGGSSFIPRNGGAASTWSGNYPGPAFGTMEDSIDINNFGGTITP